MTASATGRCPFAALEPLSPTHLADPYPRLAEFRDQSPVFFDEDLGYYVVTRHADVGEVFRDPETFSAAVAQDPVFPLHAGTLDLLADAGFRKFKTLSNADGAYHSRMRSHTLVGFAPRRLRALDPLVRSSVEGCIDDLAAALAADGQADLVTHLAFPLPAQIIFGLIGFPPEDTERLKAWCADRLAFSWGRTSAEDQARIAGQMLSYWAYCEAHVANRLAEPADDFTSDLLAIHRDDPEAISPGEVAHIIYGLSFAGHETTTNLLGNTIRRVQEAGDWPHIVADPSLIANAVEEALRFDSSVIAWRRITTRATTVGGVELPAQARLLLLLASANRDPAMFDDPERFDIGREEARRHLSFGLGKHYCLGATLAKLEVAVVLERLAARLPTLRLVEGQPLRFHPNVSFRGPLELLVTA
jgi:hypothetical protein